jgi:antitoxin PrlF
MATEVGTISTKGQVTIPKDIRDALGIRPGDKVRFDLERGDRAVLQKAEPSTLTEILGRLGPSGSSGVSMQRRLRREWVERGRRH